MTIVLEILLKIVTQIAELVLDTDEDLVDEFLEQVDKDSFLKPNIEFSGQSHSFEYYNLIEIFDFAPHCGFDHAKPEYTTFCGIKDLGSLQAQHHT